ncbi:MAG: hypothetical protein ACRDHZ_08165 [Ktedonobacteraceae bacterium]
MAHGIREEIQNLVEPAELSRELGVKKIKGRRVVRALLHWGQDVLVLDWLIVEYAERRPSHVPAKWTTDIASTKSRPE